MLSYANKHIVAYDARRQTVLEEISKLSLVETKAADIGKLSDYMGRWDTLGVEDRRAVADAMIATVSAVNGDEDLVIDWRI